jgi:hypothetical protein
MADKLTDVGGGGGNLTPETFLECYRAFREARREQSEAGTTVARIGKRMKDVGINRMAFKIFEDLSNLDTDEAVIVLKAVVKYGRWADKPFTHQTDLFMGMAVEKPKAEARREFHEFEIEDAGYRAGFAGQPIDSNPHSHDEADNPAYALWRTGWQRGQEALVHKKFAGDKEAVPQASPGKRGRPKRKDAPSNDDSTVH